MDSKEFIREKIRFFIYIFLFYGTCLLFGDMVTSFPGREFSREQNKEKVKILEITPFYQDDPRWKDRTMGISGYTIEQSGCVVTLAAVVLDYLGYNTDPGRLNTLLNGGLGYEDSGWLRWDRLPRWFPGLHYLSVDKGDLEFLQKSFDGGLLPIIKVVAQRAKDYHWVLMTGYDGGEVFLFDPLVKDRGNTLLSEYEQVGGCRVLYRKNS